jgi:hypothetical protein
MSGEDAPRPCPEDLIVLEIKTNKQTKNVQLAGRCHKYQTSSHADARFNVNLQSLISKYLQHTHHDQLQLCSQSRAISIQLSV